MTPLSRASRHAGALVLALTAGVLGGCSPSAQTCLPAPLQASIIEGAIPQIHLSAEQSRCTLRDSNTQYEVHIESSQADYPVGSISPQSDGSFSVVFVVPPRALEEDEARIVVTGSAYDDCVDSAVNDCVGYNAPLPNEKVDARP